MNDNLYIGIDSGTQGTKAVVFSEATGEVIAEGYHGYGLIENARGGREQHPDTWIDACRNVLEEVLAAVNVTPAEIRAIGVSGQQHGMVPLDREDKVIRPAKLWCDTETSAQCQVIADRVGGMSEVLKKTGNNLAVGFTASKILWMQQHEPENYQKLRTVLLPHEYINFWLCGEKCAEYGDASGTGYFNVYNRSWSQDILHAIDSEDTLRNCLPSLIDSRDAVGKIRHELADFFGLPSDVIISSGGGDNMMAAIGTGNVSEGIVTASLGTSGTIYAHSDSPVVDSSGELASFCSSTGGWLPLVCTMNVTVATELVRNLFGIGVDKMNQYAAQVKPGAEGLILLPYFNGERTPALPNAKATLTGLTGLNTNQAAICRAAMEGATFGLRYGLDVIKRCNISPTQIRLVGGGSKSPLWQQMVADIFNCEVICLQQEEAGAFGAALQAMWCSLNSAAGETSIQEITERYVRLDENSRRIPEPANSILYHEVYEKYLACNKALEKTYEPYPMQP